jgi:hypothetical protein
MKTCFLCVFRRRRNSLKCQFCDRYLEKSKELQDGLSYLENGFDKISRELDSLEQKATAMCGFLFFRRHKFSAEDLMDSDQMERIKSIAGKIKDDVRRWEAAKKLQFRVKDFYNEKAAETQERVNNLNQMIQTRHPTLWERVGGFFRNLYRAIVERLPLFIRGALTFKKHGLLNAA